MSNPARAIQIIDSHTAGEPTRVVVAGGPDLGQGTISEKLRIFRERQDTFRSAVVNEPRGSDVIVGALLVEPTDKRCGHGTIGVIETLRFLGRIQPEEHRIETPVGVVSARLHDDGQVSVRNVPSYRHARDVTINIAGESAITGDIAWGGNWFFLVTSNHGRQLELENVEELTSYTWHIRQVLQQNAIAGAGGGEIDHIELFGPPQDAMNHSRNFVLCPGKAYDRSPCGTGTSAKLACLYSDGKIKPGEIWRQESIIGSVFEGSLAIADGQIIPTITGRAFITAESKLILQETDPFKWGIR